jgi:hypothetical protein
LHLKPFRYCCRAFDVLTALESGRQLLGVGFVGVAGNVSVDPDIRVCRAGTVQLDVEDSCELVARTVQLRIGGHCARGIFSCIQYRNRQILLPR